MKHLQTYLRSETSLLPVRRWKKIRPKGSIYRRYLGRFFFFFFHFKCKVITKGFTRPAESVIPSPHNAVTWQSPTQLPPNASYATWDKEQNYKKPHTWFTDKAELYILILRDDSPIPLSFLSWYSIFDPHRWVCLSVWVCLRVSECVWHTH